MAAAQDHHDRRIAKLRELIEERRQSVEDHDAGRRRLSGEDYDRTSRQLRNFERKLAYMEETNTAVRAVLGGETGHNIIAVLLFQTARSVGINCVDMTALSHTLRFFSFLSLFRYRNTTWNASTKCNPFKTRAVWTTWPSTRLWENSTIRAGIRRGRLLHLISLDTLYSGDVGGNISTV